MAKELPKRSEVSVENTWRVEDMYATLDDWKADIEKVKQLVEQLASFQGKVGESAENLYQALFLDDEISRIGGLAYSYAGRCSDVDTKNTENQALVMQVSNLFVTIREKSAFLIPELLEIPEETLEQYYKEKTELEVFRNSITNILRRKDHMLSKEMEQLMASASDVTGTPDKVFSMFNNADLVFPEITDENGEKVCMEGRAAELNCWQITDVIESTPTKTYLIEEYDLDKLEKRKYKVTLEDSSPLNTSDNFCVEKYINLNYEYKKEEYVLTDDTLTEIIQ